MKPVRRKLVLSLFLFVVAIVLGALGFFLSLPRSVLAPERYRIPETNVTVQIPAGFEAHADTSLFIMVDIYQSFATPVGLQKLFEFKVYEADPYRGPQSPESIIENYFRQLQPEKQSFQDFDVYLAERNSEQSSETLFLKGFIVYQTDQYISFDAHGAKIESEAIYALVEAMFSSLHIEE